MLYSPTEIALVGLIMTFGSIVQGAVGFASGLIGVPLLVLCGFSLPEAATINLVATSLQNVIGAWKLREHLEPRELVLPVIVRWLALPVGVFLAASVDAYLNSAQVRQLLGAVLLAIVFGIGGLHVAPRDRLPTFWQVLAFLSSGLMMGFATIGGPPMVIYVNSLTWSVDKSRGFLFFCAATGVPLAAWMFWTQHGEKILPAALSTLVVLPMILTGLWIGLRAGHLLPKQRFRQITFALISLIALGAIASPWIAS
ncbi:MAG: sulfite exporter TauE/SafE family protein [Planctomycetes bacterium]|nr:sulfite exporter TauE/SafE family protein [Planctomycetota bacterium]